jgi:hypothetical protein
LGAFFSLFYKIGKLFQTSIVNSNDINSVASDEFSVAIGEGLDEITGRSGLRMITGVGPPGVSVRTYST